MRQSEVFLKSEGDAFYERNKDKPRLPDPVLDAMSELKLQPKAVLELGCGNGWRLAEIEKRWPKALCVGYEASTEAVSNRVLKSVFKDDVLSALKSLRMRFYDTIIFGFCLYLVDREDLMLIAAHTDRVLKDGGHIIIHDFVPGERHKRRYEHKDGVWSYKTDYSRYWPDYFHVYGMIYGDKLADGKWNWDTTTIVSVSKKDLTNAWPERKI